MRRLLVVVALLATTWPHIAAMACDGGPTPSHGSHVSSVVDEHDHEGPQCLAIMTCSAAMLLAALPRDVAQPVAPTSLHPRPTTLAPATTLPATEPPPPRRIA